MEEEKKRMEADKRDQEIVYSKALKAGKRIYYLDVKRNRKDELFLAITESKKKFVGDESQVSFEKHKIFLYKEDFEKFRAGMDEVINYINNCGNGATESKQEDEASNRFEIDFG
ncbi:MAG: PUR family DNA/RNA-binding protein [Paludibacteraceae bacterium]|nr:PUR family DNA/RNA-binding protein [Paludibacteraceae bacterium]MBR0501884.1 PUR family DNA/RNA-binding protein [Paludibacteraceae bacterium]MBR5971169.1 PUR family DNA/RNA-binding protein [Paludibacteraceae bacterium]